MDTYIIHITFMYAYASGRDVPIIIQLGKAQIELLKYIFLETNIAFTVFLRCGIVKC